MSFLNEYYLSIIELLTSLFLFLLLTGYLQRRVFKPYFEVLEKRELYSSENGEVVIRATELQRIAGELDKKIIEARLKGIEIRDTKVHRAQSISEQELLLAQREAERQLVEAKLELSNLSATAHKEMDTESRGLVEIIKVKLLNPYNDNSLNTKPTSKEDFSKNPDINPTIHSLLFLLTLGFGLFIAAPNCYASEQQLVTPPDYAKFYYNIINFTLFFGAVVLIYFKKVKPILFKIKKTTEDKINKSILELGKIEQEISEAKRRLLNIKNETIEIVAQFEKEAIKMEESIGRNTKEGIKGAIKDIESKIAWEKKLAVSELKKKLFLLALEKSKVEVSHYLNENESADRNLRKQAISSL